MTGRPYDCTKYTNHMIKKTPSYRRPPARVLKSTIKTYKKMRVTTYFLKSHNVLVLNLLTL